jgi:hypothetical protein
MIVLDCQGNQIKFGTRVLYGVPDPGDFHKHMATVVEISEPDILESDDGRVVDYLVEITVKFSDGETDKLKASFVNPGWDYHEGDSDYEEIFEEGGDLEVLV